MFFKQKRISFMGINIIYRFTPMYSYDENVSDL